MAPCIPLAFIGTSNQLLTIVSPSLTCFWVSTFEDPRDAEYAQRNMDQVRFIGRRIEVEFTRGYRKSKPTCRNQCTSAI